MGCIQYIRMYNQQYDLRVQWTHNRIFHQFSVDTAINSINSMDVGYTMVCWLVVDLPL
jgi:hypothetical protein